LLITIAAFVFYEQIQPHVDYPQAPLFDGNQYLIIVDYLAGADSSYEVSFPYNSRILVPFLAHQLPFDDIITSFKVVNLLFSLSSLIALFFLWRHYEFTPVIMFAGFFWLVFHWTGIIRLNIFDPVTVDLPLYLFQTLLLLIFIRKKFFWLIVLAPLATAQKESFLALMMVLAGYALFHHRKMQKTDLIWIGTALFLSLIIKAGLTRIFPPLEEDRNSFITVAYHLKLVVMDPFRVVRWIAAIFVAFGGFLVLSLTRMPQRPLDSDRRGKKQLDMV